MKNVIKVFAKIVKFIGLRSLFEYLILFYEYAYINKRFLFYNTILSVSVCCSITRTNINFDFSKYAVGLHSNLVTVIGILLGFSISLLAILLTVNNKKISEAKTEIVATIFHRKVSLYESILIGIAYIVVVQCCLLLFNFIYPIFIDMESRCGIILFASSIAILIHVILILMREILNFYFLITKKQ